jgi:tRNA pseudouridine32 synthase/23S rRNA pseudouridine746 synthase
MLTVLADGFRGEREPERMASPFDELGPPALARRAAAALQAELGAGFAADGVPVRGLDEPCGGKMFGVLVVEDRDGRCGFLRAFSGMLAGRFDVPGWAPPIFDPGARAAVEPAGEALVKRLLARATAFASSEEVVALRRAALDLTTRQAAALAELRARHHARRAERRRRVGAHDERARMPTRDEVTELLARESRGDKAERRGFDAAQAAERRDLAARLRAIDRRLAAFERLRRMVCRHLMRRIHETYRVGNANGDVRGLRELYVPAEPPAGAGDCVAPKLLACAFRGGLRPLALAEFWWGAPPAGGGRVAGAFYPACRDKCGPLLPFMLEGLDVAPPRRFEAPDPGALELRVVFVDDWIVVVDKPCGLLSVPARRGRPDDSVQARLRRAYADVRLVHRLDLDTSGLLVAARDEQTYAALQRQFLGRTVEKQYAAIVEGPLDGIGADGGVIDLPIRVDLDDRPRQIHDPVHGRSAITEWRRVGPAARPVGGADAVRTGVTFFPRSGRTHQLRVHAAHPLGLGAPIVGDRLYGHAGGRLMLHAEALTFEHPVTGTRLTFRSPAPC